MNREMLAEWAATGCRWGLLALIVVSPTQLDILRAPGGHLTLAEPLVFFAAICWLVRLLAQGDWRLLSRLSLPWYVVAFLLPALLSIFMVPSEGMGDALRETVKMIEYFVVGYLLYDDFLRQQPRRLRTVLYLALGVTVVIVLLALVQFVLSTDPVPLLTHKSCGFWRDGVRGTFKSRNVLAGWLALMLPVVFGVALYARRPWLRAGLWLLLLCGLLVDLSAASLGAVLLVMLLIAATRGWRMFVVTALAATFWVAVVTNHVGWFADPDTGAPQTSQQVLFRSVALYAPDGQPERRYPQWQSAIEMMLTQPWLGEGIGNYQRRVEIYTDAKPLPTGPSEPDIQNLYLVIGSTMGLPALFAFLALLLVPACLAGAAAPRHVHWRRGFVYGVAGGIAAFSITVVWHSLLVRGIGFYLVLLLVVARLLSEWSVDQPAGDSREDTALRRGDEPASSGRHRHRRRWRSPEHVSGMPSRGADRR